MISKKPSDIKSSEITDERIFLNRRNFIRAGLLAGTTLATAGIYRFINPPPPKAVVTAEIENLTKPTDFRTEEKLNTFEEITNYNNFYEFSTSKTSVARIVNGCNASSSRKPSTYGKSMPAEKLDCICSES